MIKVCGHRLLVKPILLEESDAVYKSAKKLGIELIRDDTKREAESVDKGLVVQLGATAFRDFGGDPWCHPGDTIVYAKYSGKLIEDPDTQDKYIALNDEDVVAVVKEAE